MELTVSSEGKSSIVSELPLILLFLYHSMNGSSITCVSGEFQGNVMEFVSGPGVVFIDNTMIAPNGVEFTFRDDPIFTAVIPRNVIPA